MDFRYSSLVDPTTYDAQGLCGGLHVRKHNYADLEEVGAFRAQEDWKKIVGPIRGFRGGLAPKHSIMSITMPECEPERLEIISYADEFAFMYDDLVDNAQSDQVAAENDQMSDAFREGARSGKIEADARTRSGKRQMQAKILNEMMAIDRERAMAAMKAWGTFIETSSGRQHHTQFTTLADYLVYRNEDVGAMFWHALVVFGYALTIPDAELEICKQLALPAVTAASLTNDLYSYEKEVEEAQQAGCHLTNGIDVIMRQHCCDLDTAKSICRSEIKAVVAKFEEVVEQTRSREDLSQDLTRYVEVIQYSVSGNLIWSMACPRYHRNVAYNQLQSLREVEGIQRHPTTTQLKPLKRHCPDDDEQFDDDNVNEAVHTPKRQRAETAEVERQLEEAQSVITAPFGLCSPLSSPPGIAPDLKLTNSDTESLLDQPKEVLSDEIVSEPYRYQSSLPSKGVRERAIDALNWWLEVPEQDVTLIKSVIQSLHCSSLMLDDMEDNSPIRRGKPSTHIVYGNAQTINSATFQWIEALALLQQLHRPQCTGVFIDEMRSLFIGQSYDIHWTNALILPSTEEYMLMVDGKTGGLFRLLTRLMLECSPHREQVDLDNLCRLFGRYFQIRDDYQNLKSPDYTAQKGFCEDLDEGKYSLPLIHALNNSSNTLQLHNLLVQRRVAGKCTLEQKHLILEHMKEAGSLSYTRDVLYMLHADLGVEISKLEDVFARKNMELRLILTTLQV
ncbi:Nn.00g094310.m01.CDS01 [Neocucurbitaria sp. VM-36]